MKYFIDTEFIEGFWNAVFYKKRHFIDLISIGIVSEDGRIYYAISNEYNYNDANDWVKENVILPLYIETVHGDARNNFTVRNFHKHYGKPNAQIATEIERFCTQIDFQGKDRGKPEFYAYYADYDWVLFCSLFGRMLDLPKEFPMYCHDLKQDIDTICRYNDYGYENKIINIWATSSFEQRLNIVKVNENYPKQENEHNALADAKWNKKLYEFITS